MRSDMSTIVTIFCITYNQSQFIRRTIEGFLAQKVDFKYEIIIHDDASTDGTDDIIREYAKQNSDKIIAIFEEENQYSQKIDFVEKLYKRVRGKYIAFCEGDDWWIDDKKLQIQVDYMEKHPKCTLTMHNAYCIYPDEKNNGKFRPILNTFDKEGNTNFLQHLSAGISATASFVCKVEMVRERPSFFDEAPTDDNALRLYSALQGEVYYFDRVMSIRNALHGSSWNDIVSNDYRAYKGIIIGYIKFYRALNDYTDCKYMEAIEERHNVLVHIFFNRLADEFHAYKEREKEINDFEKTIKYDFNNNIDILKRIYLSDTDDYLNEIFDLNSLHNKDVYIYGTGKYGTICYRQLRKYNIEIKGFVVSEGQQKQTFINGKPVFFYKNISKETNRNQQFFFLGLGMDNVKTVMKQLQKEDRDFFWPSYY